MTKLGRRDYVNIAILVMVFLTIVAVLTRLKYGYGSTTDWQQQHWVLPEYFRNLFYENHEVFPSFAFNIGGGQNIFNFSYYGLYSPIILISYLFPFIDMLDYIMIISILTVISSVVIFYIWLRRNSYNSKICFLVSFIFLCASPLIFQSHRQIMFVNYMPFLLLSLIGVDKYFNEKKSLFLIISTFLMIMTSYFFSVCGIITLIIYGIYKHTKAHSSLQIKTLLVDLSRLAFSIMIAVFMSGILLLPTVSAILNGRNSVDGEDKLLDLSLLIPNISLENILYSPYSLGLTSIVLLALISGVLSKKRERIVAIAIVLVIIILPLFSYILNGALYARPKVFIPLLPILCLLVADFFADLLEYRYRKKAIMAFIICIIGVMVISNWSYRMAFMADSVITVLVIFALVKFKKSWLIYIPIVITPVLCCLCINMKDTLFLLSDKKIETAYGVKDLVQDVSQTDGEFHRFSNEIYPLETVNKVYTMDYYQTTLYSSVYNKGYNSIYYDVFNNEINFRNSVITNSTKNPLFNMYMGNKYIITNQDPPIGYDLVKTNGDTSIYKNDNAFPLGYVTDKIMSESDFDKLEYPYTSEAIMEYCIADRDCDNDFSADIKEFSSELTLSDYNNIEFKENNGVYSVKADEFANMTLTLDNAIKDKILLIRFNMDYQNENEDTYIIINDVKNKLTCKTAVYPNENYTFDYLLSSNEPIEKLNISFRNGDYQISNIKMYTLDYANVKNIKSTLDPFEVDMKKTSGDNIYGKINATRNGFFVLNIPYDKGFSIKIDGENIAYEKVNKAFIGFEIEKGEHNIIINYQAPLQKEGIALTVFGIVLAISLAFFERRKVVS